MLLKNLKFLLGSSFLTCSGMIAAPGASVSVPLALKPPASEKSSKEPSKEKEEDHSSKKETLKAADSQPQVNVTLYRNSIAVVTKKLQLALKAGVQNVIYEEAPKTLIPQSLYPFLENNDGSAEIQSHQIKEEPSHLSLKILSTHEQTKFLTLLYTMNGLEWDVSYTAVLAPNQKSLSLGSMIEVANHTGVDFKNTQMLFNGGKSELSSDGSNIIGHSQSTFSYLLPRVVTLSAGKKKQIILFQSKDIPLRQENIVHVGNEYLHDQHGQTQTPAVQKVVEFKNDATAGVNFTLPEGKITLYQAQPNDLTELLGTTTINETPTGQSVPLRITAEHGSSGVTCELEQTDYKKLTGKNSEAGYHVTLTNRGDVSTMIKVFLALPPCDWTIVRTSMSYDTETPYKVKWEVEVPPGQSIELKYRLKLDNVQ